MSGSHIVTITIEAEYPHGKPQKSSVSIAGSGDLDHMIEAFKASLVVAGFSLDTIKRLDEALDV